jgi:hypothetical protein
VQAFVASRSGCAPHAMPVAAASSTLAASSTETHETLRCAEHLMSYESEVLLYMAECDLRLHRPWRVLSDIVVQDDASY